MSRFEMREHRTIGQRMAGVWFGFSTVVTLLVLAVCLWCWQGQRAVNFLAGPTVQAQEVNRPFEKGRP